MPSTRAPWPAGCSVAAALLVASWPAHANGRFPAAQFVTVAPGPRGERIALTTTFGVLTSVDGGASWSWLCEEFLGYGARGVLWDPPIAWAGADATASLLVGLTDGLTRVSAACESAPVAAAGHDFTGDLTTTSDGVAYQITSNGTGPNRLRVTRDGGASFRELGALPEGMLPETLEVLGTRVYVMGVTIEPRRVVLYRSDDGGESFRALPFDARGASDAWLSAIDPRDADTVYVRAQTSDDAGAPGTTLLLRSSDGGQSFVEITRSMGPMLGFALSGDGMSIWTGGADPRDGLRRSVDRGLSFERVSDLRVQCLRWHPSGLYVCAPYVTSGFALGRSTDGGRTITPVLRFEELAGPPRCPAGSLQSSICAPRWPTVRALFVSPDAGPLDASTPRDGSMDGATDATTTAPPPGQDCGCHASNVHARGGVAMLALALAGAARRRRARRATWSRRP